MAVFRVLLPPAEAGGSSWPWRLLFEYIFFCEQTLPWQGGVRSIVFGKRWEVWVISEHLGDLTALVWHLCALLVLARVATRCHKLGGFNNRNVFLTTVAVEGAYITFRSSDCFSNFPAWNVHQGASRVCLVSAGFLVCRWHLVRCLQCLQWEIHRDGLAGAFLVKAQFPSWGPHPCDRI